MFTGADPGFPVGVGANPRGGEAPTYDFAKFCEKLHEIEKILGRKSPKSATVFITAFSGGSRNSKTEGAPTCHFFYKKTA